ncbi:hypothetical protein 1 [Hubei tombus-like virus 18]|uniref:hypothetical protein 1 n=1 Tax=Hubei tombus-like virus 18 TaxID=1923264 RepID=UPI00090A5835|nr:hypothetical protein 1 [Hubei tombus-like virus 18]APG76333.1 hypothetical protein 1 [Hubei tombus-like virus 18]
MANAQPAQGIVGLENIIAQLQQLTQDPNFDPQLAEDLILATRPVLEAHRLRRERVVLARDLLIALQDGEDPAGDGLGIPLVADALENVQREIIRERGHPGVPGGGMHRDAGLFVGEGNGARERAPNDAAAELRDLRVVRERDEHRRQLAELPDNEEIFGDVWWMFGDEEPAAEPPAGREIAVGPDIPGTAVPAKVRDKYRSNKTDIRDPLPEATRDLPEFRADLVSVQAGTVPLFTHRVIDHRPLCDQDVYAHLQAVTMFMPRTPGLAVYMRERALRFVEGYDTGRLSRMEINEIIGAAIANAYVPSVAEMQLIRTAEYIPTQYRLDRFNEFFRTGDSSSSAATGPKNSLNKVNVVRKCLSKRWIVGIGLLAMASLVILRKPQLPLHIPTLSRIM